MTTRNAFAEDLATVLAICKRDLVRFVRERSRVVGALVQPVLFWFVLGQGYGPTFAIEGSTLGYSEYFFPGVVTMVVLFTAIFSTTSVIEDRHAGFLQGVIVGPASRAAVVLGKVLGGSTIAVVQAMLFLLLAPLAGFPFANIAWFTLLGTLLLLSLALTAIGFVVAWRLDSVPGYHVVMNLLLLPMWMLSGAMFPAQGLGWATSILRYNPLSYGVSVVRSALYNFAPPVGVDPLGAGASLGVPVCIAFALLSLVGAVWTCERYR